MSNVTVNFEESDFDDIPVFNTGERLRRIRQGHAEQMARIRRASTERTNEIRQQRSRAESIGTFLGMPYPLAGSTFDYFYGNQANAATRSAAEAQARGSRRSLYEGINAIRGGSIATPNRANLASIRGAGAATGLAAKAMGALSVAGPIAAGIMLTKQLVDMIREQIITMKRNTDALIKSNEAFLPFQANALGASVEGNVERLLARIAEAGERDEGMADLIRANTRLDISLMELRTAFLEWALPFQEYVTQILNVLSEIAKLFFNLLDALGILGLFEFMAEATEQIIGPLITALEYINSWFEDEHKKPMDANAQVQLENALLNGMQMGLPGIVEWLKQPAMGPN